MRLLPLLFVSPEQVNAYLPSDLADGEYSLAVRNGSLPEIAGKVSVVRNAPGIFGQLIGDQLVATAQRPDGSLAAPDKPVKRGEQIILMGSHEDRTALGREFGATDVIAERGEEGVARAREALKVFIER